MILNTIKEEMASTLRKAAMLLVCLGEQSSAELLQQLSEDDVQKVSREVAKITAISSEQAENVLEEFHHISAAGDYVARGGIDYARKLLMRAFNPDVAKRLLDKGFHAPTTYFPSLVPECLLIEPTETESKQTLDAFVQAMKEILEEAHSKPELVKTAPHTTPVRRLDEVKAARELDLAWKPA